jgi:hypothetical protein
MKEVKVLGFVFSLMLAGVSYGHEKDGPRCERKSADGKVENMEVKDKAECKTKGGKWMEAAKDKHDHKEGAKHDDHKDGAKHDDHGTKH